MGDNMLYRYEIIPQETEDVLYLYLNMKYEFGKELSFEDMNDIGRRTKNFIQSNHIPFKGNKVYLVVDGVIVKTIDISKYKGDYENNSSYSCDSFMINIRLDDNSLCEISLREYLLGVLLSKYMNSIHDETLKAMCVLYNTYAYQMMSDNNFIFSTNPFAIYKPSTYYKAVVNSYDQVIDKLNKIITEVDCTHMRYKDQYILPFIHYSNTGKTLSNTQYPYLSSVKSLWDLTSPYYIEIKDFSYKEINEKLNISINSHSVINMIMEENSKKVVFGNNIFTIEEIKTVFDLKSSELYIIINNDSLRFITKGWGNSYGLSIFGSNEIAKNGAKYYNILNYYFPKANIYKFVKRTP